MKRAVLALLVLLPLTGPNVSAKTRSIHVFVALCDNEHQGIVPVPKQLGNGDDPANNLYWGALYGTKTFLKRSKDWTLVATEKRTGEAVLERAVFKHAGGQAYLVADAYRGRQIKRAVTDFLHAAASQGAAKLTCNDVSIGTHGAADLVVYVGHNGLMEFRIQPPTRDSSSRAGQAIILACKSKPYFQPLLAQLQCRAVLLTTGFMAPEAYTLEAALAGWLRGESGSAIKDRAARAYHKYQKCGLTPARRLFCCEE